MNLEVAAQQDGAHPRYCVVCGTLIFVWNKNKMWQTGNYDCPNGCSRFVFSVKNREDDLVSVYRDHYDHDGFLFFAEYMDQDGNTYKAAVTLQRDDIMALAEAVRQAKNMNPGTVKAGE